MHNIKKITKDIYYIGANDRRLLMFEGVYSVPKGVSYNSYVLLDDVNILFDTVDKAVEEQFFENLEYVLKDKKLDYIVIHHMEPDHSACLKNLIIRYPNITIVCNALTKKMIDQFFVLPLETKFKIINEGDVLETKNHSLMFLAAPMVHWPEVIMTYDKNDKILFSADAFGTFNALNGRMYADEFDFNCELLEESRRYYTNIVGKYGPQVQNVLKKAKTVDIKMILPLHGPVWRENLNIIVDLYDKWSQYIPEVNGVLIAYASVYGHTENVAEVLASKLNDAGVVVKLHDTSTTDSSYLVSDAFKYSHLVFASTTYNMGIFIKMDEALRDLVSHNIQNRTVAFIENGSWAPTSGALMKGLFKDSKNITYIDKDLKILSSLKENQESDVDELVNKIKESINLPLFDEKNDKQINDEALFKISYGLYVLSAYENGKDNACIINTAQLVTDTPFRISVTVNKNSHTHDMIMRTKKLNVSILTNATPFDIIKCFGFRSGKEEDKFIGINIDRDVNGLAYLNEYTNAFIAASVTQIIDLDTHTLFIASVDESKMLSNKPSLTYQYYFDYVKPKINKVSVSNQKQFACKICGYVYTGNELPENYVCPLCKHGKDAFIEVK